MPDEERRSPRTVWKEQPEEESAVTMDELSMRRTHQMHVTTRSEIVMSLAAALFLVLVLAWRLPQARVELPPLAAAAVVLWIAITLTRLRTVLWRHAAQPNTADTGLAYYRRELEVRRNHLRNAWLWHGPVVLAAAMFAASFTGAAFPGAGQIRTAAPLIAALIVWIAVSARQRYKQAADLQREIDEIARLEEEGQ